MRKSLVGALVVVGGILLCLWLGLIPWTHPDVSPGRPDPDDRTTWKHQQADSLQGTTATATEEPSPQAPSTDAERRHGEDEEKLILAGYTLDQDGRPLARSRVGLYEADAQCGNTASSYLGLQWSWFKRVRGPSDEISPAGLIRLAETESDDDGYFEFSLQDASGSYHLRCLGPERLFYCIGGPFSVADSPVRCRLQPVHELLGMVVDAESGWRVARATIDVIEEDLESRKDDWGHVGERSRVRRSSDADGLFRFDLLPSGPYRIEVVHPDYSGVTRQAVEVPLEADPFLVSMTRNRDGVSVHGRITDALTGRGVEGAFVEDTLGKHRTISGPSGDYHIVISKENANQLRLTVTARSYGLVRKYFHGTAESEEWNVALRPARRLAVRVVTKGERSVRGAKVFVRATVVALAPRGHSSSRHKYYRVTNDDGLCTFVELPAVDQAEVFVFHPVHGTAFYDDLPLQPLDDPSVVTLEIAEGPVAVIARVRTIEGDPVPGAQVLLKQPRFNLPDAVVRQGIVLQADFGDLRVGRTDAQGIARFPGAQRGDCLLQAFGEGYRVDDIDGREAAVRSEVVRFDTDRDETTSCELVLWSTFDVYGRVKTSDGVALEGVLVNLLTWSEDRDWVLESPMVSSNGFGNYRFTGLSPVRRFAVSVRPKGMLGRELQWKNWKRVSTTEESEPTEQDYWEAQGFSVSSVAPKELLYFMEIPAPSNDEASRVDIVLDLPPR